MDEQGFAGPLEITIENFRGVKYAKWKPQGVCALVGPNGSGKSTILSAFMLMGIALDGTLADGIKATGSPYTVINIQVPNGPARITISNGYLAWSLSIFNDVNGSPIRASEELSCGGVNIDVAAHSRHSPLANTEGYPRLNDVHRSVVPWGAPVDSFLKQLRKMSVFAAFQIESFRNRVIPEPSVRGQRMAKHASAAFSRWKEQDDERFLWVRSRMNCMFPSADKDLLRPMEIMSSGELRALLTLSAVAECTAGSTLMFDQPDDGLHPQAVARLVRLIRERAEAMDFTVVLASHSTALLDEFNDNPDEVWVVDAQQGVSRLTDILDAHWLKSFRLGSIYGSAFGRQIQKKREDS